MELQNQRWKTLKLCQGSHKVRHVFRANHVTSVYMSLARIHCLRTQLVLSRKSDKVRSTRRISAQD